MSSREIAQIANKRHSEVLRAIRNMQKSWEKVTQRKFALSEYTEKVRQAETPEEELTLIKKELETLKNQ